MSAAERILDVIRCLATSPAVTDTIWMPGAGLVSATDALAEIAAELGATDDQINAACAELPLCLDSAEILIDGTHALMTAATFDALPEYSCTAPTLVKLGNAWKRHDGLFDDRCPPAGRRWLYCWYDVSERGPGWCSTRYREILLADGEGR